MNENKEFETELATPLDFSGEIVALIRSDLTPKKMRERIEDYHEKDIALALEELSEDECQKLLRILPMDTLVSVLEYADDIARFFVRGSSQSQQTFSADRCFFALEIDRYDDRDFAFHNLTSNQRRRVGIWALSP